MPISIYMRVERPTAGGGKSLFRIAGMNIYDRTRAAGRERGERRGCKKKKKKTAAGDFRTWALDNLKKWDI